MNDTTIPFGMTAGGFNKKTFGDIKLDIQNQLYESFGTIRIDEESVFGQLIGVFTEPTAQEWLALESIYNALNPNTATDFSLDNIVAYIGIKRLEATATTAIAQLTGLNQTTIPTGSEVTAYNVNTVFKLDSLVELSNLACLAVSLDLNFTIGNIYSVRINNDLFTYTAQPLDVKATVVDALALVINDTAIGVIATNVNDNLVIKSVSIGKFKILHNGNMFIIDIMNEGNFTAVNKGDIALPAGALINIQTPISGWISINNSSPGLTGRNLEIDDELRERRTRSLKLAGAGTVDAIRARILNITGVTAAIVNENVTDTTIGSLPPHSFETLVLGGDNQVIANTIWTAKPAGIPTYGNVTNTIIDTAGKSHIVYFSRPVKLYIYASIALTKDMALYPINGDSVIKSAIANQINNLEVGEDVVYQSLYQSIYSIPGITAATIQIGGSLVESPPTLSSANIVVGSAQVAVSDITKINIT